MTVTAPALPIASVIRLGELDLEQLDDTALLEQARRNYANVEGFRSDAATHYYLKVGYTPQAADELFQLVLRFMALSAAWHQIGHPGILSLPERADLDGWHGFLIQTRDYATACGLIGTFVHHATTERAQGDGVARTLALLDRAFGPIGAPSWADCPGCVIYGWCSD